MKRVILLLIRWLDYAKMIETFRLCSSLLLTSTASSASCYQHTINCCCWLKKVKNDRNTSGFIEAWDSKWMGLLSLAGDGNFFVATLSKWYCTTRKSHLRYPYDGWFASHIRNQATLAIQLNLLEVTWRSRPHIERKTRMLSSFMIIINLLPIFRSVVGVGNMDVRGLGPTIIFEKKKIEFGACR